MTTRRWMAWAAAPTLGFALSACTTLLGDDFTIETNPATGGGGASSMTGTNAGGNGAAGPTMSGPGGGQTQAVCGNGALEAGEACDDGNTDAGDGCSKDCSIEGTCTSPVAMPEASSDDVTVSWKVDAKTGGESQVGVAVCDGSEASGFGSDRIYSFTTSDQRDVTVSFTAEFSGLVRLMSQPCDPATEIAAFGQATGCSSSEALTYRDLPAGAYFVVIDGAQKGDEGTFSVNVQADCPKSHLQLSEMRIGSPDTVSITHTGSAQSCSVSLTDLSLRVAATSGGPKKTDLSGTLAPSQTLVVSDQAGPGETSAGTTWLQSHSTGHYAALCRVQCDQNGSVIDLFAGSEGNAHPSLPPNTSFSPEGLSGIAASVDLAHVSYQRTASNGTAPNFLEADWAVAPFGGTLFYDSFEDGDLEGWSKGNLSSITYDVSKSFVGTAHGDYGVQINGNTGSYDGLSRSFPAIQPSSIHFRVKSNYSQGGVNAWVMIGDSNVKSNDGLVQLRMSASNLYASLGGQSLIISTTGANWVRVEYNNIDWSKKELDFVVKNDNGGIISGPHVNKAFWATSTPSISQVHLYTTADSYAYFDGFIMTK